MILALWTSQFQLRLKVSLSESQNTEWTVATISDGSIQSFQILKPTRLSGFRAGLFNSPATLTPASSLREQLIPSGDIKLPLRLIISWFV
jgi:hypothetical protein